MLARVSKGIQILHKVRLVMNRLLMRKRFLNILFKISVKSNFEKSPKWKLEGNNGEHYFDLIDARYRELSQQRKMI